MKKKYDILVVGSGLMGSTVSYLAHQSGKRCLVLEKRNHTGGNIHCEEVAGVNVHQYGAHILHTHDEAVWKWINRLAPCNRYTNSPVAVSHGKLYALPFNMNTFYQMWGVSTPEEAQRIIQEQRREVEQQLQGRKPENLEEQALMMVGRDLYEALIRDYTRKQWGRDCKELPAFIIRRIPLRFTFDNNYFNDPYQGIPIGGYNVLIDKLLEGVEVRTEVDFLQGREEWEKQGTHVLYTGPIDAYFDFCFGPLQYRTVRFDTRVLDKPNHQGVAVMNHTDMTVPFTRTIEHKHFEMFGDHVYDLPQTVVSHEYSEEWHPGIEPYYPVNDTANQVLYAQYHQMAQQNEHLTMGGRLAEYRYYDMVPTILRAMQLWEKIKDRI